MYSISLEFSLTIIHTSFISFNIVIFNIHQLESVSKERDSYKEDMQHYRQEMRIAREEVTHLEEECRRLEEEISKCKLKSTANLKAGEPSCGLHPNSNSKLSHHNELRASPTNTKQYNEHTMKRLQKRYTREVC